MISNAKASTRHTQYKDELSTVGDRQPNKIILFMLRFITLLPYRLSDTLSIIVALATTFYPKHFLIALEDLLYQRIYLWFYQFSLR